ncbi:hypothetical protein [Marinospirillum perlucidum]|uniref:hypothetical protein n=1 Tax=Marinospirillum perlucidum TaxID=1982602 RepID=UPI00138FA9B4|nr:hypothetical protein [Marinospirillum perlucidum]
MVVILPPTLVSRIIEPLHITLIRGSLEEEQLLIFRSIHQQSLALNIPYLVVGATARDLILVKAFGVHLQRATQDIDFAIKVANWDAFENLKSALLESGFQKDRRRPHRLNRVFGIPSLGG